MVQVTLLVHESMMFRWLIMMFNSLQKVTEVSNKSMGAMALGRYTTILLGCTSTPCRKGCTVCAGSLCSAISTSRSGGKTRTYSGSRELSYANYSGKQKNGSSCWTVGHVLVLSTVSGNPGSANTGTLPANFLVDIVQ